ncbi:hypothetical protein EBU95_18870 [bacterium]|nr:hypothetical protein [bacterium]
MPEKLSTLYTNIKNKATILPNKSGKSGAFMIKTTIAIAGTEAIGDVWRLFSVPSSGVPSFCGVLSSAITSATDCDLGIYSLGENGAVLDKDVLIDGLSLVTATVSTVRNVPVLVADGEKTFWQLAGLTSDPGGELDICWTFNAAPTAAGTVVTTLFYNANN